jgi:hypothetical protein
MTEQHVVGDRGDAGDDSHVEAPDSVAARESVHDVEHEPDVSSGDVLDADELEAEIADDEGMAGSDRREPSAVGDHAIRAQEDAERGDERDGSEFSPLDGRGDGRGDGTDEDLDEHDAQLDAALESWDDGSVVVGRRESSSGALPFVVSAREEFAALGDVPVTGEARVDAATARLDEVADLPTTDHVAVYDDVHRRLQDALADADTR